MHQPNICRAQEGVTMKANLILKLLLIGIIHIVASPIAYADTPTASAMITNVTVAGGTLYSFTVTYNDLDGGAIDFGTLGNGNVRVTGPGGFDSATTFVSAYRTTVSNAIATYSLVPPGGSWDSADNGTYSVVMQANQVTDEAGHPVSPGPIGTFTVTVVNSTPAVLSNISTRAFVQTGDNVMIGGFIVQGTGPKRVIVRAIGPELTQYGITNALANPTLELHNQAGALIGSNDNWQTTIIGGIITGDQVQEIQNSGDAPGDPRESAIIANLQPGNYTAIVRGVNNTTGVALVEVYDLAPETSSILGNISTRSFVQTVDNVMIGGFIVQGTGAKSVIIRAIGPELSQYGVPDPLADPTLELHDGTGALIASNNDWQHTIISGIITRDQVQEIQNSGHAPTAPSESAIIANLRPGNYTAIVRGVNNTIGVALVEVYGLN
jgi:hypothetical protein